MEEWVTTGNKGTHELSHVCMYMSVVTNVPFPFMPVYLAMKPGRGYRAFSTADSKQFRHFPETHLQVGMFELMLFIVYLIRIAISHNAVVGV